MDSKLDVNDMREKYHQFGVFDYVVFVGMLIGCALIGLLYAFKKRGSQKDVATEYLMGGRKMTVFPISVSLVASFISGITVLGNPTEIYLHGTQYVFICLGVALTGFMAAYVFLPVFHEMKISSTYEYLEKRFDKSVRSFGSIAFTITLLGWLPIVIYVPALAFNLVTGVNVHIITPCVCLVCIFYTTIGGLKAVVWTDVVQTLIMVGAVIIVIVKGTLDIGGFGVLWERSLEGDRIEAPSFQLDFKDRHSIYSLVIGGSIYWLQAAVINQNMIQRYMALPTVPHVKRALWIFIFGSILSILLCCFCGLLVYATYHDCDPLTTKLAQAKDQLLPLLVMQVLGSFPGMPGLFVAGVFSASLSSLSTGLNAMSAVVLEDFVKAFFPHKKLSNRTTNIIMKSVVVILGALCVGLVFVVEKLGTILQLSMSLKAMTSGPSFGIFCGGILFPWMNAKGAFYGGLLGLAISGYVTLSAQTAIAAGQFTFGSKPMSVANCSYFYNTTTPAAPTLPSNDYLFPLFQMSYLWYTLFGGLVTLILAMAISYLTGFNDPSQVNPVYLSPVIRKYLPKRRMKEEEKLLKLKLRRNCMLIMDAKELPRL